MLMVIILYIILLIVVLYISQCMYINISKYIVMRKVPGPPQGFLIGNLPYLGRSAESLFNGLRKGMKEFYPIYRINTVHMNAANILSPEDCEVVLNGTFKNRNAGSRNCVGQKFAKLELKAGLCAILSNFILEPTDTPETIVLVVDVVLRTKDGIKVRFIPRK